jgi:hypothetical protein
MKQTTFYHEFKDKRRGQGSGNCVATFGPWSLCGGKLMRDAVAGIFDQPNTPVCITTVSKDYLRDICRRVSERAARKLHPQLFVYLDETRGEH